MPNNQKVVDEKIKRILWDSIPHDFPKITNSSPFMEQDDEELSEDDIPKKRILS